MKRAFIVEIPDSSNHRAGDVQRLIEADTSGEVHVTPLAPDVSGPPIKIVCGGCGSANVRRDAYAEWDPDIQKWMLGVVFDAGICEDCGYDSLAEELLNDPSTDSKED